MTEEEIKNLKIGDKFTMEYKVSNINKKSINVCLKNGEDGLYLSKDCKFLQATTLVKPVPTFEVGDTVRIVPDPMTGTVHNSYGRMREFDGLIVTLSRLKKSAGQVMFKRKGNEEEVSIHCLELIKKVVKDKYFVKEFELTWGVCRLENPDSSAIAIFCKNIHPAAKTAARAECARLNAEWRKQQEYSQPTATP